MREKFDVLRESDERSVVFMLSAVDVWRAGRSVCQVERAKNRHWAIMYPKCGRGAIR